MGTRDAWLAFLFGNSPPKVSQQSFQDRQRKFRVTPLRRTCIPEWILIYRQGLPNEFPIMLTASAAFLTIPMQPPPAGAGLLRFGHRMQMKLDSTVVADQVAVVKNCGFAMNESLPPSPSRPLATERSGLMPHTPWTLLFHGRGTDDDALKHLNEVLRMYWRPLKICIERRGFGPHESEDITQDFLSRLVHKGSFDDVDREKGRLRSYLLTALNHFLSNVRRERSAQFRGGGLVPMSLDASPEEGGVGDLAATDASHQDFDREWAIALIGNVMEELRAEFSAQGKADLFDALKPGLLPGDDVQEIGELGKSIGLNAGATRVALHRLRLRFRNLLYRHVASTVGSEAEIEDEIRALILSLRHH